MTPPTNHNLQQNISKSSTTVANKGPKIPSKPATPNSVKNITSNIPRIASATSSDKTNQAKPLAALNKDSTEIAQNMNFSQPNEKDVHHNETSTLHSTKSVRAKKEAVGSTKSIDKKVITQDVPDLNSNILTSSSAQLPTKDKTSVIHTAYTNQPQPPQPNTQQSQGQFPVPVQLSYAQTISSQHSETDRNINPTSHTQNNAQYIDGHFITSNQSNTNNPFPFDSNLMNDGERVLETSPNGRYAKLNTILGKGAYKVVYKAIDREEGYEVAWNCFQVFS